MYITVSNAEYYDVLNEDADGGETNWTISRHARPGDLVLHYICAPVSAVVAVCTVATSPQKIEDPSSPWFEHWMADMSDLRMLKACVERRVLIERFPLWGYWRQPRTSVCVPRVHIPGLEKLIVDESANL